MSNTFIVSGGLSEVISAGSLGLNGPNFPIKYFLLAYDPAIDTDVHFGTGSTSAVPFSATVVSGDTALVKDTKSHYIFNDDSSVYTLSLTDYLTLTGSETGFGTTTLIGSDKSSLTQITLCSGSPIVSATSASDLYTSTLGTWKSASNITMIAPINDGAATKIISKSNYFSIDNFSTLVPSTGGKLRGLFKCRVDASRGDFKFNKIGIYVAHYDASHVETNDQPTLFAIAALNKPIVKTKTGYNLTNVEFDIELEFDSIGDFSNIAYLGTDYWTNIPAVSGNGLYTNQDVAIGTSGTPSGWLANAKLDIVSPTLPILRLEKSYSSLYSTVDIVSGSDVYLSLTHSSGFSQLSIDKHNASLREGMVITVNDPSNIIDKKGISIINNGWSKGNNIGLFSQLISNINGSNLYTNHGIKSEVYNFVYNTTITNYGIHSYVNSYGIFNCAGYFEVTSPAPQTTQKYGVYTKAPEISANGTIDKSLALYVDGVSKMKRTWIETSNLDSFLDSSLYIKTTRNTIYSGNQYGIYSEIINGSTNTYAGYFSSTAGLALVANGDTQILPVNKFLMQSSSTQYMKLDKTVSTDLYIGYALESSTPRFTQYGNGYINQSVYYDASTAASTALTTESYSVSLRRYATRGNTGSDFKIFNTYYQNPDTLLNYTFPVLNIPTYTDQYNNPSSKNMVGYTGAMIVVTYGSVAQIHIKGADGNWHIIS